MLHPVTPSGVPPQKKNKLIENIRIYSLFNKYISFCYCNIKYSHFVCRKRSHVIFFLKPTPSVSGIAGKTLTLKHTFMLQYLLQFAISIKYLCFLFTASSNHAKKTKK